VTGNNTSRIEKWQVHPTEHHVFYLLAPSGKLQYHLRCSSYCLYM
jgi:hypothetical protein